MQETPAKLRRAAPADRGTAPSSSGTSALLDTQIKTKLAELKQTIDTRRKEGFDAARRIVETDVGADAMSAITDQIGAIITTENRLLDQAAGHVF